MPCNASALNHSLDIQCPSLSVSSQRQTVRYAWQRRVPVRCAGDSLLAVALPDERGGRMRGLAAAKPRGAGSGGPPPTGQQHECVAVGFISICSVFIASNHEEPGQADPAAPAAAGVHGGVAQWLP